jgi:FKBP-type peptidyl-prolyl cis-trans isomerase FkpA
MKSIQYKSILQLAIILIIGISCTNNSSSQDTFTTESGISYQFVNNGSGETPPEGGYWIMNLAYYNAEGDTLFSSANQGGPMPMNYTASNFKKNASIEECFSLIGEGDSAVFYINADSLYKNSAGGPTPPDLVGTNIKLSIGIEKVFTTEEFVAYTEELTNNQIAREKTVIEEYLSENGITAEVTEEGLYYEITETGNGEKPQVGQSVKVNYTGYLLDGTVFDTSIEETAKEAGIFSPGRPYNPLEFPLGQGRVIKGWDIGIGLLGVGGKAKLVVPSPLAYGKRGNGALIKANSTLVFSVELVEIVE